MLAVHVALRLGDRLYDRHGVALRLRRCLLPGIDRLEVHLPAGTPLTAAGGDPAVLDLDGGEGEERVFTGEVTEVARTLLGIRVTAHGGSLKLARYRPALSLEKVTAGDAIRHLCADVAVDTGDVAPGPTLALYGVDGRSTALQEVVELAWLAGAEAALDGDGRLHAPVSGGPGKDVALRYGREIVGLEAGRSLADPVALTVVGEGGGGPLSPQGRWVGQDFLKGMAAPGPARRRRPRPLVRTVDDARAAAEAWGGRRAAREQPVRLLAWLLPVVSPGARVELHDLPAGLPAEVRVEQVVHQLDAVRGATTRIWATSAVESPGEILAAAAGRFP